MGRKLLSEGLGTLLLLTIVVGSGIMGERLSGGNSAIALLANTLATACGLYVLINLLGPISGAHFNPLVSMMAWQDRSIDGSTLLALITAQLGGGLLGVGLAHLMFELPLMQWGIHTRTGMAQWLAEAVATAGLILTIRLFSEQRPTQVAAGVACYIAAAYWFTASTSFANPVVTIARSFTATFSGIYPADVPGFVAAQIFGAFTGYWLAKQLKAEALSS
ncbi:MAG: aquaporin [Burkholderiaceae bacterium]|nr:aquaporin [Burkholderiaceae bacterium]